jgi:DNA-directed RNA polymerase subunit N (RpoN/RPB10)
MEVAKMSEAKPIRCQKCGKPIGYVTVLRKGLMGIQQPIQDVKIIAVCLACARKE